MSFSKKFFFLFFALALMLSLPGIAEEEQKQKVKFTIHVGGLVTTFSQGYEFSFGIEDADATWTEFIPNLADKFGLDVGVGIFPISQLELYASYSSYNGTALGVYNLRLPHAWDDEIVSGSIRDVENDFKISVFSFGLAFHPTVAGKFKPYFGVGLSSVNVKIDFPDSVSIDQDILAKYYLDYDPPSLFEVGHTIDITKVGFTEESKSAWGFHAKAGANVEVIRNICIFAEARYLSATAKFDRPDITYTGKTTLDFFYYYENADEWTDWETLTRTEEEERAIDDTVKIKVGGIQGIIGIKFSF